MRWIRCSRFMLINDFSTNNRHLHIGVPCIIHRAFGKVPIQYNHIGQLSWFYAPFHILFKKEIGVVDDTTLKRLSSGELLPHIDRPSTFLSGFGTLSGKGSPHCHKRIIGIYGTIRTKSNFNPCCKFGLERIADGVQMREVTIILHVPATVYAMKKHGLDICNHA
jgi:hypothetical protein